MARFLVWHGTSNEAMELLNAVQRHCECRTDSGRTVASCAAHRMLVFDQRAVDGLLFIRWMAPRLLTEEFGLVLGSSAG